MKDGLPFLVGFVFIAVQPILDRAWLKNYQEIYDPQRTEKLVTPAKWVADTAQFLPSAALTIVGVALLIPDRYSKPTVIAVVAVGLVIALVLYLAASTRTNPGDDTAFPYSWLQLILAAMNAAGLVVAFR